MADYEPDLLGKGGARRASEQLRSRRGKVDAVVEEAIEGEAPPPAPKKPQEPMSKELMRRVANLLRGKKDDPPEER